MSKQSAHDFLNKLDRDEELRKKVRTAVSNVLGVAKDHGHEISHKDLEAALAERMRTRHATAAAGGGTESEDEPMTCISEPPGF